MASATQVLLILAVLTLFEIRVQSVSIVKEEPYVGVNIGTDVSSLLPPAQIVSLLQTQHITHVRLFDADPSFLRALANTKIHVILGVPNNQLLGLGSSNASTAAWVKNNVVAFFPDTTIVGVAVGDEVLTSDSSAAPLIMPAIEGIHSALVAARLDSVIKVSTPHSMDMIVDPFPPSQAFFNHSMEGVMLPLLRFLQKTGAPLMMNLYPYYVFMQNHGVVPLDNALFRPITAEKEEVDPNTLLHYTNVLDAMIDAAYVSMENLNFSDIIVLITESGWPSKGDHYSEPYATDENADTYNSNLIKHVLNEGGTPKRPEVTSNAYIYELFNEDLRKGPLSEANWGLFYGNAAPVYVLHVSGTGYFMANDTTNQTFCVAMDGVDKKVLQAALDWACGQGRANCSEIQPGESCYDPNNVPRHASYAFDSYYQKAGRVTGSCDFGGAAIITTTDPSADKCVFPGSQKSVNASSATANTTSSSGGCVQMRGTEDQVDFFVKVLFTLVFIILTASR